MVLIFNSKIDFMFIFQINSSIYFVYSINSWFTNFIILIDFFKHLLHIAFYAYLKLINAFCMHAHFTIHNLICISKKRTHLLKFLIYFKKSSDLLTMSDTNTHDQYAFYSLKPWKSVFTFHIKYIIFYIPSRI